MTEDIIHVQWVGPISFEHVRTYTSSTDYGVYQVYGHHPLYGRRSLLYLGKAQQRPFGVRLIEEGWAGASDSW